MVWKKSIETLYSDISVHLNIGVHLGIIKYSNIFKHIFKVVELQKTDKGWKKWEKKCKEVFGNFLFLVTMPALVI